MNQGIDVQIFLSKCCDLVYSFRKYICWALDYIYRIFRKDLVQTMSVPDVTQRKCTFRTLNLALKFSESWKHVKKLFIPATTLTCLVLINTKIWKWISLLVSQQTFKKYLSVPDMTFRTWRICPPDWNSNIFAKNMKHF